MAARPESRHFFAKLLSSPVPPWTPGLESWALVQWHCRFKPPDTSKKACSLQLCTKCGCSSTTRPVLGTTSQCICGFSTQLTKIEKTVVKPVHFRHVTRTHAHTHCPYSGLLGHAQPSQARFSDDMELWVFQVPVQSSAWRACTWH